MISPSVAKTCGSAAGRAPGRAGVCKTPSEEMAMFDSFRAAYVTVSRVLQATMVVGMMSACGGWNQGEVAFDEQEMAAPPA